MVSKTKKENFEDVLSDKPVETAPEKKEPPKKKGFFARLFGGKKKPEQKQVKKKIVKKKKKKGFFARLFRKKDIVEEIPVKEKKSANQVETDFDKIFFYIKEKKNCSLGDIAKDIDLKKTNVVKIAETLEQYNLIKINYPPIGDIKFELVEETNHM